MVLVALGAARVVIADVASVRRQQVEETSESSFVGHLVDQVSVNDSSLQKTGGHATQLSSDRIAECHPHRREMKMTPERIAVVKEEAFLQYFWERV